MPVVQPAELWKKSKRWESVGPELARFKDRAERDMLLSMTHEEVVAELAHHEISSYRDLPRLVYQIQTKFRDEPRARGGLIRVREFVMKDSYSLDQDAEGLQAQYDAHYDAYLKIGQRVRVPLVAVLSDVGMMGGNTAHEFMYVTPIGEDTIVMCASCEHAANLEIGRFNKPEPAAEDLLELEEIETPGAKTIEDLAKLLEIEPARCAKAMFYSAYDRQSDDWKIVLAVVRGDMDVNETKVRNLSGASELTPASAQDIEAIGAVPGYASPIGLGKSDRLFVIVDDLIPDSLNMVMGANREGYHVLNANYGRDYEADLVSDITEARAGDPCPDCHESLRLEKGVEVGNIFQLGTRYCEAMDAYFTDEDGKRHPIIMGSYGIGLGRLLACVAEENRDENGLSLPISVAPYHVSLVQIGSNDNVKQAAEELYENLQNAGIEVLFDDRDISAGIKFKDADLIGIPIRIAVSERLIAEQNAEIKLRSSDELNIIPLSDTLPTLQNQIRELMSELSPSV